MIDAATLLWTDAAFGASAERAASRFALVRTAVAARRDLGDERDRFLDATDAVAHDTRYEDVWSGPRPYWWAHAAEAAVASGDDDLVGVLQRFPIDVLAAAHTDPGAPVATCGDYVVPVTPSAFDVPDWPLAAPALAAGVEYHATHVALVERTLSELATVVPETFDAFSRVIKVIGLKPRDAGGYDDFSNPELPGTFVASVRPEPLVLADHFVHELQHNRLSFVEELEPLFDDARPAGRCYSPWRDDHRSPYGVFHGVYVFLGVHEYWRGVVASGRDDDAGAYARDQVARIPLQLDLALAVLEEHAALTPFGASILTELGRTVAEVPRGPDDAPALVALEREGGFTPEVSRRDGRPLSVREAVGEHVALHA